MNVARTLSLTVAAVLSIGALTHSAFGHHGFGGRYDLNVPVWIEGEVIEAYFGQPHAELKVHTASDLAVPAALPDMESASGFLDSGALAVLPETQGRDIVVELPPTQQYFGLGDKIRPGDRIAVVALRNCEEPHQLNGQWLRLADGEIVVRSGPMTYMVKGC
ncbi:hypothetical protein ACLBWS_08980 [Brucellaceae bacterium D45D]